MVRAAVALHCGREAEAEELFLSVTPGSPLGGHAQRCLEHLRSRLTLCRESARTLDGTTLERAEILKFMRQLFAEAAQQEYLEVHGNRYAETLLRAAPFLSGEYRYLDVGSYCGEIPVMLWKFLDPARIHSCSLTPGYLAYGEGRLKREGDPGVEFGCRVEACNIERDTWPYADASVDVVLCLEVLEHLREHPLFMMAEANRVLEDGGLFVLTTPNTHSFYHVLQILRQDSPNLLPVYAAGRGGMGHVKEYTFAEIRALFEGSGFELVLQQTFSPYSWAPDSLVPALKEALRPHGLKDAQSGMLHFVVARKNGPPRYEYLRPIYESTLPR
jgi:SAM-dependent methyltransferase